MHIVAMAIGKGGAVTTFGVGILMFCYGNEGGKARKGAKMMTSDLKTL